MLKIHEILRAQHISRWTIVATAKPQSLAEHTFNVAMIARDFCRRMEIDDTLMMKAAMEHDLDEILTGDIPSPAKARMREKGIEPNKLEGYQKNVEELHPGLVEVLKAIDVLESGHFLDDFGIGKRARAVAAQLKDEFTRRAYAIHDPIITGVLNEIATEIMKAPRG